MDTLIDCHFCPHLPFQGGSADPSYVRLSGRLIFGIAVSAALLLSVSGYAFYTWYRLSHIPGPFWTSYSFFKLLARGQLYEDYPALNKKYGNDPLLLSHPCPHVVMGRLGECGGTSF